MATITAIIELLAILLTGKCFCSGTDNNGNEFYLTFLENYKWDRYPPPVSVSMATEEDSPVNVTITAMFRDNDGALVPVSENVIVQPGHLATKQLFPGYDYTPLDTTTNRDKGIHILAGNKTISIVGVNEFTANFGSTDAFLALPVPVPAAANELETFTYIAGMIANPTPPYNVSIGIVAYMNDTELLITPTQNTTIGNQRTLRGNTAKAILNKGDTLLIEDRLDLSGTRVESNHPIAFFIGSQCANIPTESTDASDCDHLVEQIPPVEQWGTEFITAPLATRREYDVFKIVASSNNTIVHIHCNTGIDTSQIPNVLNTGEFATFNIPSTAACYIMASEKVLLLQFSASQSVDNVTNSDPFMAMVPSISHYSNSITFMPVSSNRSMVTFDHYVNMYILADYFQPGNIMLNERSLEKIGITFEPVKPCVDSSMPIGYVAQVNITGGLYALKHLTEPNAKMGVLVYGFGEGTSYGYPGGLALGAMPTSLGIPFNECKSSSSATAAANTLVWGCVVLAFMVIYRKA